VVDDAGTTLAGKGSKTGPNLYGVFGRAAGSLEGFKYGESIVAVGAAGYVWDEAGFVEYVQDPAAFLKVKLDDKGAKSKMSFKVKNAETAADLYAFLAQFSAAPAVTE
jgi:cytochrome c